MKLMMTAEEEKRYVITNANGSTCDMRDVETGMLWKNAPLEDVQDYIDWQANRTPATAEATIGCDLDNYSIVSAFPSKTGFVLLMASRKRDDPFPWCIRSIDQKRRISTRYFRDVDSLLSYAGIFLCSKRLTHEQYAALSEMYWRRHFEKHMPIRWADWQKELEAVKHERHVRGRKRTSHVIPQSE